MMQVNLADSESDGEDARMEGGSYGSLTRQEQSRFNIKEKLGEGAYGKVYKAYDNKLRSTVALKVIRIEHADEGIPSTALREIGLLRELAHGGIVQLLDVITSTQKLTLVFEYFHVDLKKQLDKRRKPYTIQQTRSILWQTMNALQHCHSKRIMHRDIKPSNLLIDEKDCRVKLADFGLARSFGLPLKTYTHEVVTLWYRAPEIILGARVYSTAIDVWSLGCILYECAHKKPLFYAESEVGQLFKIFQTLGTPDESNWQGSSELPEMKMKFPKWHFNGNEGLRKLATNFEDCPEAMDLLTQMVQLEPSKRITLKAAMQHPFFAEYNSFPRESSMERVSLPSLSPQKHRSLVKASPKNRLVGDGLMNTNMRKSYAQVNNPFEKLDRDPLQAMNLTNNRICQNHGQARNLSNCKDRIKLLEMRQAELEHQTSLRKAKRAFTINGSQELGPLKEIREQESVLEQHTVLQSQKVRDKENHRMDMQVENMKNYMPPNNF